MIRHTVMFTLMHAAGSDSETEFLDAALVLSEIETVKNFERLRQTSMQCDHQFGFSMEFETEEDYQTYNDHAKHTKFVSEHWNPEVESFQEIDYVHYE